MSEQRQPMKTWARILCLVLGLALVGYSSYALLNLDWMRPRMYVLTALAGGLMLLAGLVHDALKRRRR